MRKLIQWPTAKYWTKQWNLWIGCNPRSPACDHCYAEALTKRFGGSFNPHPSAKQNPPRSGVVFCGNMTDLFGPWIGPQEVVNLILKADKADPRKATFLWLTKRAHRMGMMLNWEIPVAGRMTFMDLVRFPNHYFGFTAEDSRRYYQRMADIELTATAKHKNLWLSAEPLLGPINMGLASWRDGGVSPFKWVVVGAESGPKRRHCDIEWIRNIVRQCRDTRTPVFVKQIELPNGKFTNNIDEFPADLQIRQVPWKVENLKMPCSHSGENVA